jgi:hypothetical protein
MALESYMGCGAADMHGPSPFQAFLWEPPQNVICCRENPDVDNRAESLADLHTYCTLHMYLHVSFLPLPLLFGANWSGSVIWKQIDNNSDYTVKRTG